MDDKIHYLDVRDFVKFQEGNSFAVFKTASDDYFHKPSAVNDRCLDEATK